MYFTAIRKFKGEWIVINNRYQVLKEIDEATVFVEPSKSGMKHSWECSSNKHKADLFTSKEEAQVECDRRNTQSQGVEV